MKRFEHDLIPHGELSSCRTCGGAEGALPTLCPGRRLTGDELDAIYANRLDFDTGPMVGVIAGAMWWMPAQDPALPTSKPAQARPDTDL